VASHRRLRIWLGGAAATVTLVAVGPGGLALGANPNDSNQHGARGANSPGSGPGSNGQSVIGRGAASGPDGHTGKQGQNGADGPELDRGDINRGDLDIPLGRGRRSVRGTKGLQGRITRQVHRALAEQGIQS